MTPLLTTWCNKLLLARRNFRGSVASAKLNKLDGGAQPCPLRSRNKPSGNVPVELNNLSVSAIAPIKKSAEQVKHRKNANEDESAIVFGTSDNWKKKTQEEQEARQERNRLRYERQLEKKPRSNGKRAKSAIVFVHMKVEP
ncbi:hypothetical protein PC129_g16021 [Phytophthora cactorum]|uniref:Uncharacterized protein n=1 Tax=Phytophthora cactorum TaxID=29920 RepID=A0A8T1HM62_9STRA|nr:hypothetical protein PC129_g16021 [Phytophthora cactorum]